MSDDSWLNSLLEEIPGYEEEIFLRFSDRLYRFARSRLPVNVSTRVDAEDVVQSVFRSFFRRHSSGQFEFHEEFDVWQLLAAITFRKVANTIKFHRRELRSVDAEIRDTSENRVSLGIIDPQPGPEEVQTTIDYIEWLDSQLPDHGKEIMRLRLEGNKIAEIAEQVSVSQRTVKRVLAHVRDLAAERIRSEESTGA